MFHFTFITTCYYRVKAAFIRTAQHYFKCNNFTLLENVPVLGSSGESKETVTHIGGDSVSWLLVPGGGRPTTVRGRTKALTTRGSITHPTR
jgi:hypothetical protein